MPSPIENPHKDLVFEHLGRRAAWCELEAAKFATDSWEAASLLEQAAQYRSAQAELLGVQAEDFSQLDALDREGAGVAIQAQAGFTPIVLPGRSVSIWQRFGRWTPTDEQWKQYAGICQRIGAYLDTACTLAILSALVYFICRIAPAFFPGGCAYNFIQGVQ